MATTPIATASEASTFSALSNEELGQLWCDTVRSHAVRRTGSSRDHWRKLLDDPDAIGLFAEFKRRAIERQEEYEAWLQWRDHPGP